ncbi:MAG TPA: chromate efflux transporter [Actinomycetota bacterium]|nr:chromate efflux transporter [Actinomycetota bacterium]
MTSNHPDALSRPDTAGPIPFRDALRFWVRLGFINFGGPTGQIAIMHEELVVRRRWIDERGFLHALNFSMLLPGPEAHQLAIYVGWLLHGAPGAVVAGVFFLLPALVLILGLSWVYATQGHLTWLAGIFDGLSWGVLGIVAAAVLRIADRAVRGRLAVGIAVGAFAALFLFGVPFPAVIAAAAALGIAVRAPSNPDAAPAGEAAESRGRARPSLARTARVLAVGVLVWIAPLAAVAFAVGTESVIAREAVFFAFLALVTFGGAYAVLAYVNQAAVLRFGWLGSGEMAVGLSLAETTPGPLILVVVFVGYVAAFREPGTLSPQVAGLLGGMVTAWATFVPSFLWIFLGAPSVERLRGNRRLSAALSAITAAVVGVVANLALVFAVGVLFDDQRVVRVATHDLILPVVGSVDLLAVAVAIIGFVGIRWLRANVVWVVLGSGLVGLGQALV